MPGGGSKKGERRGGRQKGAKNKKTLEREREIQLAMERAELEKKAQAGKNELLAAQAQGKKLLKDMGFELAQLFYSMAAYYQPDPNGRNQHANEEKFLEYAKLAVTTAGQFAPFESPKLGAVMIGAAVVNKVIVEGGMPDDFASLPPASAPLPAGTIIEAEDDYVSPVAATA